MDVESLNERTQMKLEIAKVLIMAIVAAFGFGFNNQIRRAGTGAIANVNNQKRATRSVELSARLDKVIMRSTEPNRLTLSVKNRTQSLLYLEETYPERDYKFDVRTEKGDRVSLTKAAERMLSNDAIYRHGSIKIKPGEEAFHSVEINNLYEMSVPGTYTIVVKRKILGPEGKEFAEAVSNIVKVKVVR